MKGFLLLRIREIVRETPLAATFILETRDGEPLSYRPGQFLTLVFERRGMEIRRSYSFSSTPGVDPFPMITVKEVENGEISRFMLSELKPGDELRALPPAGRFVFPRSYQGPGDIILLAAGSGIVPVFSILKMLLREPLEVKIILYYSNYNEENIIFRKAIDALAQAHAPKFRCFHLLSRPAAWHLRPDQLLDQDPNEPVSVPQVIHGYLNNQFLERLMSRHLHYEKSLALFFICGPFTYMRMAQITLRVNGFIDEQFRKENFVVREPLSPRFKFPAGPFPKEVSVRWEGHVHHFQLQEKETILDAALREGLELPFSCKAGACSTCIAQCRSGEVKMSANEVLTTDDIAEGFILTCVAYPVTEKTEIVV